MKIVKSQLGKIAERDILELSLSNDTISYHTGDIPSDIHKHVQEKLCGGKNLLFNWMNR